MSKSLDPKPISVGEGEECPKCGEVMERFKHSPGWKPQEGRGYFRFWDRCQPCGHFQNYEKFRVRGMGHAA